jgi:predicted site-specific integrase-resolvase
MGFLFQRGLPTRAFTMTILGSQPYMMVSMSSPNETRDDLVNDFVSSITSMAARIYGRRALTTCAKTLCTKPPLDW